MKGNKPTSKPPVTAKDQSLDDELENPRSYLGSFGVDGMKEGHRVLSAELDPQDRERNPARGTPRDVA